MIDSMLFHPALLSTTAAAAAVAIAAIRMNPHPFKVAIACIVIAPIAPLLATAWCCGKIIDACSYIESCVPGRRLFAWAADTIVQANQPAASNVIPLTKHRRNRK